MVLNATAGRKLNPDDVEELVSLRNAARVKLGFENPHWYLQRRAFNICIRAETVNAFLGDTRHERILDIGCGDGSISLPFLTAHNRLTLVDMSEAMLSIARSRIPPQLSPRVTIINDQFEHVTLEPAKYDLIICLGVLAYIDDIHGFARKVLSLSSPGGDLLIECTDSNHLVSVLGRAVGALRGIISPAKVPLVLHSSSEVIGCLIRLGFNLRSAFRYSLPPPGMRRILSQGFQYKGVRALYGSASHNRVPWLGSECIYHFRRDD